jgi:DNA-binding winged helix-turn-helix (wHTH) protein/tetratricopeptide (TPR) repeat protein
MIPAAFVPAMHRTGTPTRIYRFGLYEADATRNSLTRNGSRIKIHDQPLRVLLVLLERPSEIVSREELRQQLWPDGTFVDFDGSLNVILKKLRAALDDDSDNPRFIETVYRRGYRFIAPVTVVTRPEDDGHQQLEQAGSPVPEPSNFKESGEGAGSAVVAHLAAVPDEDATDPRPSFRHEPARSTRFSWSVPAYWTAAALAVAVAAWFLISGRSSLTPSRFTLSQAPAVMRRSIAVLGFHNTTRKATDDWFSTAFSEMLSTELAGGNKLRLVSGEDVANLKRSAPWSETDTLDQATTARLGEALNAGLLVLGSYTTIANDESGQVRLDVRLQEARTGEILTEVAETGSANDLFEIVSRAGEKLRDRLGVPRMGEPDEASVLASLPHDREAARFYSLGLVRFREFDFLGAKELFIQAIGIEPKFCFAHLRLAQAWAGLGYEQKRKEEVRKALELSSDLSRPEQLQVQGEYYESLGDHEKASSVYRALFELFPDNVDFGLMLANAQQRNGHDGQAAETLLRLRRLPAPASDDPRIDLLGARVTGASQPARLALIRSAEQKANAQHKNLTYAEARKQECLNLNYSQHPEEAPPACEEAYGVYVAAGNRLLAAETLRIMGDTEGTLGHIEQAITIYHRALQLLDGMGEHYKTGSILNNMAIDFANEGKVDQAEEGYRQAKSHFETAGDKQNTATALGNIADILFLRGDIKGANKMYEEALDLENSFDRPDTLYLFYRLSDVALAQGRVQDAHRLAQRAIDAGAPEQGDYQYFTLAMIRLGEALKAEGNLTAARRQFQQALEIQTRAGEGQLAAASQLELADLDIEEGHAAQAESGIRTAIAEFEKEHQDPAATAAYTLLSRDLRVQQRLEESRQAAQHAIQLGRGNADPELKLGASIEAARVQIASNTGAVNSARQDLRSAISTAKRLGYYTLESEAHLALLESDLKTNTTSAKESVVAFASEARSHGLELIARRAEQITRSENVVATGRP